MILKELISSLPIYKITGNPEVEIRAISDDSRKVEEGTLFIAVKGFSVDGHRFIPQAIDRGATAIVTELGNPYMQEIPIPQHVTVVEVRDSRRSLAMLADAFYGHPSSQLRLIGVTGTNGKTTTTNLIYKILTDYGKKTGLIGTIETIIGTEKEDSKNTTPESIHLHRLLARMVEAGCTHAVMEVSSHSLDQGRVRGADYAQAIFTNLTQDHLDYHKTMEEYRHAKGLLFAQLGNDYTKPIRPAILNADDPASEYFARITAAPIITYGIDRHADVRATDVDVRDSGIRFHLETWVGSHDVELKLVGKFNVYNALAAIAATLIEGIPLSFILQSLSQINGVNGRFERIEAGQDYTVIVDYAHTPDSLENVLVTIREFAKGRVICIVGCGGERDRGKRPLMARIAAKYADHIIFTSDNPRRENPERILEDMLEGLKDYDAIHSSYEVITDRKEAIYKGIQVARTQDVVLIAGKGHETYQILGEKVIHFDDREIAAEAIRGLNHA